MVVQASEGESFASELEYILAVRLLHELECVTQGSCVFEKLFLWNSPRFRLKQTAVLSDLHIEVFSNIFAVGRIL